MIDLQKRAQLLRFAQLIMAATIFGGAAVDALASSYPTRAVTGGRERDDRRSQRRAGKG